MNYEGEVAAIGLSAVLMQLILMDRNSALSDLGKVNSDTLLGEIRDEPRMRHVRALGEFSPRVDGRIQVPLSRVIEPIESH